MRTGGHFDEREDERESAHESAHESARDGGAPTDATPGGWTAERLAQESARRMWVDDRAARAVGIRLNAVTPGGAVLEMTVGDAMVNGHGLCHGGYVFTLADTALAYASNSYGARTVAASAEIHFLAPAHRGDTLTATAFELKRTGRGGLYDVTVTDADGERIAVFRGRAATIRGRLVDDAPTGAGRSDDDAAPAAARDEPTG